MTAPTISAVTGLPDKIGRYKIVRLLGRGSFAVVALAWDEELESAVALKILHTRNRDTEKIFLEEARMLRRIQSLNVIAVHDIGRLQDGTPYFVVDYASRGTLLERLEAGIGGPNLAKEHAVSLLDFIDGLTDGLTAIHRAGMVHRDIKPANILFCVALNEFGVADRKNTINLQDVAPARPPSLLIENDERVLVGDLGIAKDLSKGVDHSTLVGGTPFYLAPEQRMSDQTVTAAADIYSATALLWRLLLNETPPANSVVQTKLDSLPAIGNKSGWRSLFEKGLSENAENRFQTADEWRWSVHEILGGGSPTVVYQSAATLIDEPQTDICPYKGLAAYEEGDSRFFRGRDALVSQLSRRLQLESVLVVGGPSGSGKSSLLRAGLIPLLKKGALPGSEHWQCLLMTPGARPVQALDECLKSYGGITNIIQQTDRLDPALVLVVDQFEEIFTIASDEEQDQFLQYLADLTDTGHREIKLIITVRADFYSECARIPWLARIITSNQVLVGPMTSIEMRQAITEPAHEAGYELENGLVSAIIDEAGHECGSLPLVAHALVETWVRRTDRALTLDGFRSSGGVAGAISQSADATYEHELDEAGRDATRRLMLNLVNPGDGSPDTRRVVAHDDIFHLADTDVDASILAEAIRKLTAARLLTVDDNKVQIAHEALLRNWPRLRNWIDDSRDDLRMRRRISLQVEEWQTEGHEPDLLYRGTPLFAALDWREANPKQLGVLENSFLDAAQQRHLESEKHALQSKRRARRVLTAGVTLLMLLAIGASLSSVIAYRAYKDSQRNAQVAEKATDTANLRFAGALGAAAFGHHAEDPRLSLVIASEAMARTSSSQSTRVSTFDTRAAMVSARQILANGGPFLHGSPVIAGDAMSIALNPMGSTLAMGNVDGEVLFLDVATHEELQPGRRDHDGGVRDLDFSPDGKSMVSVGADGKVLLWQTDSQGIWTSTLIGQSEDVIPDVDFHPSGEYVMSANHDATVQIWYIDGRAAQPDPLASGIADVNVLAISDNGRFVVAANADKTISGWNIETGELIMGPVNNIHDSHLLDIKFTPSADNFITMTTDGESKLVSFPGGEIQSTLFEDKERVGALLMNSTRGVLIGGNNMGQLSSWNVETGSVVHRSAAGHSQIIKQASMTHDERLIATLGRDQLIRFWTINDNYPMGQRFQVDSKSAKSVVISPDGTLIASGDEDGQIKLWRLDSNDSAKTLSGHTSQVWALSFSSDSSMFASADRRGNIKVWDVNRQRVIQIINLNEQAIWSIEFVENQALMIATDSVVYKYSIDDAVRLDEWPATNADITRLALSPDKSKALVTYANGNVSIRNMENGSDEQIINIGDDLLWSAALNHSGNLLAAASSDETVLLIDIDSGQRLAKLTGHQGGATNVAFLSDGATLVASDRRGSLHWWDIETARRLAAPWRGHRKAIWRMSLHPDGNRFATAGDDGKVWIWDALSIDSACEIGIPSFDTGQKNQYLGSDHQMQACQ